MTPERLTWLSGIQFAAIVVAFVTLGPAIGGRVAGVVGLIWAIRALKAQRVGVGIEGYEPSFFITGRAACLAASLSMLFFIVVIIHPEWFFGSGP